MAPLPSRKSLESMKRADLQKLCKDYGVKANLKSEALIDLLLDTIKPAAAHAPARRSVSTRHSSRAGPSRVSSIVIHNTDDDEEEEGEESAEDKHSTDGRESDIQSSLQPELTPPATRTRKGKEQTRLGVGRPVAAGGSGPRAVTKSLSVSKKRSKGSRSMKPTEATIVEEVESETNEPPQDNPLDAIPQVQHDSTKSITPEDSIESLASIDKRVADALRPLHEQMKSMKSELELMQALKVELKELKAQVGGMGSLREKVETLTATVRDLRKEADESASLRVELKQYKETLVKQATPSTPKSQTNALKKRAGPSGFGFPPSLLRQQSSSSVTPGPSTSAPNHSTRPHPGIAPSMLGKRHRDLTTSDIEEDNQDDEMPVDDPAKAETKLARKRAKFFQEDEGSATEQDTSSAGGSQEAIAEEQQEEDSESALALRVPSFTVFSGLDELPTDFIDPPPPTERLPDFFTPPSPPVGSEAPDVPRQGRATTSTANAAENQQPFAFSFQPITSTPAHGMFLPSFPYPEPPQSPSPAGTNPTAFLNQNQLGRSDVFQSFGFPPPGRPPRTTGLRNTSGLAGGFIDPAALSRLPSDPVIGAGQSSSETATRTTDSGSSTGMGAASETPQLKRTMYGTELEGDTRFGDFGVEGVGNTKGGFWAGGRY
ncbi:hypothetical protein D9615_005285 [Tricholomella constricta]|uniref:Uncharacterized protein n=1 Tax=Tricholomella constricta TaxID=117010 RepID=A0A8H5H658_9AGAR|nr:hypothetical protein D9615_005285 [Tricholomella constricta]